MLLKLLRRNGRAAGEKPADAHKALAILLDKNPSRINELVDSGNKFEVSKFNTGNYSIRQS